MAVLVQRLVGSAHGDRFYPTFAGVASSYNFYTFRAMRPEDGVAQLALGLGKSVVDGFGALRMCPHHPQVLPQFSAIEDILRNAQRTFYALDLSRSDVIPSFPYDANLERLDVAEATNDAAAAPVFSTYQPADDVIRPGLRDGGAPIVTFASLLKGQTMPLPEVLVRLLDACQRGLASPIELEFAADLKVGVGRRQTFHALQLRPLVIEQHQVEVEVGPEAFEASIVRSDRTLGSGRSEDVPCAIVVDPRKLDRSHTKRAARVIEQYNHRLNQEQLQAVLLGPGRWGSRDPWLGIPVVWSQISAARAIVEVDFPELQVEPSLGSHFFHNLTCFRVAFLAVHSGTHQGFVDWDWFARQPAGTRPWMAPCACSSWNGRCGFWWKGPAGEG